MPFPMATPDTAVSRPVPFLDLEPIHAGLRDELVERFADLVSRGDFINGPEVEEFERAFASFCGTSHCVGVASGLDALRLGFLASGIEPGDEVIVPAMTFVATFEAVTQAGGTPVVVDVCETDYNLDLDAAKAVVGPRTRYLLPVHLYGQLADAVAVCALAESAGLTVIEDACQAHGAERDGLRAGQVGTAAAFSFYPGKNLGALGDAGALVSDDPELVARVRALREHGQFQKYAHALEGYTARLDTIQAAFLLAKLPQLARWNEERRALARAYAERLDGVGDLRLPAAAPGSDPVWHLYVVRTADPAALVDFLAGQGIGAGRHYPEPPHLSAAYARFGYGEGAFPVAERIAREAVSLPLYPGMSGEQQEHVCAVVSQYFGG